jgi:uncharacterized protein (TIGR02677 family)
MSEERSAEIDPFELAGFPGRLDVAAYLTADQYAAQYRVIVDALLDAQEHSLTGAGRDEIMTKIREVLSTQTDGATVERLTGPDAFDLDARMKALHAWGVVIRWQDKAKSEADFIRTRDRYQLTSEAADLHRWLRRKVDDDAVATSAAAFAPAVIADRLDDTLLALADDDHAQAARAWAQVRTTLRDMADAAAIWQSRLASALAGAPDDDKMRRLRETLLAYVTVWGAGIDTYSPRVRDAVTRLDAVTDDDWRAIALAGLDTEAADETVRAVVDAHHGTAETLQIWFHGTAGQAQRLRRQVRDAVVPLLRGSRVLLATGGPVTRRAELLRIAAAVEAAPDDAAGWRTWCAAMGLWSARHLPGFPRDPETAPSRTSFWDAPAVPIDLTLRQRGVRSLSGRASQLPDRRAARAAARRQAEQARADLAIAEHTLLGRSGVHLADWDPLGQAETGIVWEVLTAIMRARPDKHGVRMAYNHDGSWHMVAFPAPAEQPSAVIHTPHGRLACENWRLELSRA